MTDLHNMSVEQIIADIENIKADADGRIVDICLRLVELRRRKCGHPYFTDPVFRHFDRIASGKTLPALVAMYSSDPWKLKRLGALSPAVQKSIVNRLDMTVAEEQNGEVVEVRKPVVRMTQPTLKRAFPESGGVATFQEQRAVLLAEIKARKPTPARVRADPEKRCILVGKSEVSLGEIKNALKDLGFTLAPVKP